MIGNKSIRDTIDMYLSIARGVRTVQAENWYREKWEGLRSHIAKSANFKDTNRDHVLALHHGYITFKESLTASHWDLPS